MSNRFVHADSPVNYSIDGKNINGFNFYYEYDVELNDGTVLAQSGKKFMSDGKFEKFHLACNSGILKKGVEFDFVCNPRGRDSNGKERNVIYDIVPTWIPPKTKNIDGVI